MKSLIVMFGLIGVGTISVSLIPASPAEQTDRRSRSYGRHERTEHAVEPAVAAGDAHDVESSPGVEEWTGDGSVAGDLLNVHSDGSDGALNVTQTTLIDLSLAASQCDCDGIDQGSDGNFIDDPCRWDCPSPVMGQGVYDNEKWAVVFKFVSAKVRNDGGGIGVSFKRHPSGAPVVWLVQTTVEIGFQDGISLAGVGSNGAGDPGEPPPGAFRGGRGTGSTLGSGGFGPGGGEFSTIDSRNAGSHATTGTGSTNAHQYGNSGVLPLIGGSGGSGNSENSWGGSSGGGAILIAAGDNIRLDGGIGAQAVYGDSAGGSGGAIRLVSRCISGNAAIYAGADGSNGNVNGGTGRIRLETIDCLGGYTGLGACNPEPDQVNLIEDPVLWLSDDAPKVVVETIEVNGTEYVVPADPRSRLGSFGPGISADISLGTISPNEPLAAIANIRTFNVPLNWEVIVRVVPKSGTSLFLTAPPLTGTPDEATTSIEFELHEGFSAIQARARKVQ